MNGYLMIDESNNDEIPEIIVGGYSFDERSFFRENSSVKKLRFYSVIQEMLPDKDNLWNKDESFYEGDFFNEVVFPELRGKYYKNLEEYLKNNFRHIVFDQVFYDYLRKYHMVIATSEFIRFYNPKEVLIDGCDSGRSELIERFVYPRKPKIVYEPRADVNYKLMNEVDALANFIFRIYSGAEKRYSMGIFLDKLLTPKLEEYAKILPNKL